MGLTTPDGSGYLNFQFRSPNGTFCELSLHPAVVRRESHDEVVIASARFDDDASARLAWQEMHRVQVQDNRQQVGLHELPATPAADRGLAPAHDAGLSGDERVNTDAQ